LKDLALDGHAGVDGATRHVRGCRIASAPPERCRVRRTRLLACKLEQPVVVRSRHRDSARGPRSCAGVCCCARTAASKNRERAE
jgi:hypothetical protein